MKLNQSSRWHNACLRLILAGFVLGTMSVALVAWLDDPPFATVLFYVGIVLAGIGALVGMIGILMSTLFGSR